MQMLAEHSIFDEDDERTRRNLARLKKHLAEKAGKAPAEVSPIEAEAPKPTAVNATHPIDALPLPLPVHFAPDLAKLQAERPANVDERRWRQAVTDARRFLTAWGGLATGLGWTADDLFGLHPIAPLARYEVMGLIWTLRGREVVGLDARAAQIRATSGGLLTFTRPPR
jgi:hypothetical protein